MKQLLLSLIFVSMLRAADTNITISWGTETKIVSLPESTVIALQKFVNDSQGKHLNVVELILKHLNESLFAPLVQRYPEGNVKIAQDAAETAKTVAIEESAKASKAEFKR